MSDLKSHQLELLRYLVARNAPTPAPSLDGRNLRPLKAQELVVEVDGFVSVTELGRSLARPEPGNPTGGNGQRQHQRLSEQQEEVLRYLIRQTGPVPEEHLDGRVLRALQSRSLVSSLGGWVAPTEQGRTQLAKHEGRQRASRQREARSASSARAGAIHRAVEQLEAALPRDAELTICGMPAYADDVVKAFRQFARRLESAGAR